jgi:hypothetical protein
MVCQSQHPHIQNNVISLQARKGKQFHQPKEMKFTNSKSRRAVDIVVKICAAGRPNVIAVLDY